MGKNTLISQDTAVRCIEDALRLRVGRGRRYTFQGLSDATGIPTRTLESYVDGATPSLANLLSLFAALGPSFTSDVLSPAGQSASDAQPDDPQHMQLLSALCGASAMLSDAVADGKVDHREEAQLRPVAADLIAQLEPLARGGTAVMVPIRRAGDA
jgi:hypothetical protein